MPSLNELEHHLLGPISLDGPVVRTISFVVRPDRTVEPNRIIDNYASVTISPIDTTIAGKPLEGFDFSTLSDERSLFIISAKYPYIISLLRDNEGKIYHSEVSISAHIHQRIHDILQKNKGLFPASIFALITSVVKNSTPSARIENEESLLLTNPNSDFSFFSLDKDGTPTINPSIQANGTTDLSDNWQGDPNKPYRIFINGQGGLTFECFAGQIVYKEYVGDMEYVDKTGILVAGIVFADPHPTPKLILDTIKPYLKERTSEKAIRSIVSPYIRIKNANSPIPGIA